MLERGKIFEPRLLDKFFSFMASGRSGRWWR